MDAKTALDEVNNAMEDYQSFTEGFDHEFHGEPEAIDEETGEYLDNDEHCRFDFPEATEGLEVLRKLLEAATAVVDAEPDELFEGKLNALAEILGTS